MCTQDNIYSVTILYLYQIGIEKRYMVRVEQFKYNNMFLMWSNTYDLLHGHV